MLQELFEYLKLYISCVLELDFKYEELQNRDLLSSLNLLTCKINIAEQSQQTQSLGCRQTPESWKKN